MPFIVPLAVEFDVERVENTPLVIRYSLRKVPIKLEACLEILGVVAQLGQQAWRAFCAFPRSISLISNLFPVG